MFRQVWKIVKDKADKARMVELEGERIKERRYTKKEEEEVQEINN